PPKDDAVASEQRARRIFDRRGARLVDAAALSRAADHGPAAAILDVEGKHAPAPLRAGEWLALARGHEQSPQAPETVGRREPERHEFAERFLELGAQQARGVPELIEKHRAAR